MRMNKIKGRVAKALLIQNEKARHFSRLAFRGNCPKTSGIANGFRSSWELSHMETALKALRRCAELREMLRGRREVVFFPDDFLSW